VIVKGGDNLLKKHFWLQLFAENDTALATATHLIKANVSEEADLDMDVLKTEISDLYSEMAVDQTSDFV